MIELRWLERKTTFSEKLIERPSNREFGVAVLHGTEKVLQYRTEVHSSDVYYPDGNWSEWQDVPVVREEP